MDLYLWLDYRDIVTASGEWFPHMVKCGLILYLMMGLLKVAEKYFFQEEKEIEEGWVTTYTIPRGRVFAVVTSFMIGMVIPVKMVLEGNYDLTAKVFFFFIPALIFGPFYISRRLTGDPIYRKILYVLIYALVFFSYLLTN